jgi:hypothetical protein
VNPFLNLQLKLEAIHILKGKHAQKNELPTALAVGLQGSNKIGFSQIIIIQIHDIV